MIRGKIPGRNGDDITISKSFGMITSSWKSEPKHCKSHMYLNLSTKFDDKSQNQFQELIPLSSKHENHQSKHVLNLMPFFFKSTPWNNTDPI